MDPENAGADPVDPQSWNGYSYVLNMPLNLIDPRGEQGAPAEGSTYDWDAFLEELRRTAELEVQHGLCCRPTGANENATGGGGNERQTYDKLTEAEKNFIKKYPLVAVGFFEDSEKATAEARRRYPRSQSGGAGDAFRHALWSALMTRRAGVRLAKKFGDAHEDFPANSASDRAMDLYNNRVGREVGAQGRVIGIYLPGDFPQSPGITVRRTIYPKTPLADLVDQALRNGRLKTSP